MIQLQYETDRLILRVLNDTGAFQVLTFLAKNRELFEQYEGDKSRNFYTMNYIKDMLQAEYNQMLRQTGMRYYIFLKTNPDKIIGTISLSAIRRMPCDSACVGYKFDMEYHHHGYAFEALSFFLANIVPEYRLHKIAAYIAPSNQASIRLIERLGFFYEGTAIEYAKVKGKWTDHRQYAFLYQE